MVVLYIYAEKPIATIFVIMLASIVTNIEGNPIPSNEPHQKYWWHEPCTPRTKHSGRHTRDIPNTVRTQINITYHRMLKIYGEHKSQMHNISSTLPDIVTKTKLRLSQMHLHLQYYAATIHNITKIGVSSKISSCGKDDYLLPLHKMKNTLKTLLCEISTAMKNKKKEIRVKKYVLPSDVRKLFGQKLDCSKASIYQSSLITSFTELLKNLNRKYNKQQRRNKSSNRSISNNNNSSNKSSQQI